MNCSSPGCRLPAVIQWRQLLPPEEVDAHLARMHRQLEVSAEERKLDLRVRIASVQDAIDHPPPYLSPQDTRAFQKKGADQKARLQQEHDEVPTTFDLEHHREGSYRSLFACEKHDLGDADWYTRMHHADCNGTLECGCSS